MKKKVLFLSLASMLLASCGGTPASTSNSPASTPESQEKSTIVEQFNITFNDEDGNLLESKKWNKNSVPSYNYVKQDTEEWNYTVEGWSTTKGGNVLAALPAVTADATYYAIVSKAKQVYTIQFDTDGGSAVDSLQKEYGSTINEPAEPEKEGYHFVSWCTDSSLSTAVTWPYTVTGNKTFYAKWNEKTSISDYLKSCVTALNQDPYSYIPDSMKPTYSANYVTQNDVTYDFTSFTSISTVNYGGFGEQWQMVIDNIMQSQNYFAVLSLIETAVNTSVVAFNNHFDKNPSDTNKEITDTGYYAKVNFANNLLTYTIQIKTGKTIPFFGEVLPQIDMTYDINSKERSVRINLSDTNAMRYIINDNSYIFAIEYGVEAGHRTAYCSLTKDEDENVNGHIYEYITLKDKDAVKSCADFYIGDTYTSVVGNKASGIIGFDGYINELYKTDEGKLVGYKVKETKTVLTVSGTWHTLWFNLSDISGITNVKLTDHTEDNDNTLNTKNVYVNNSSTIFTPAYNTQIIIGKTSRKFDIEYRTRHFYGLQDQDLYHYSVSIPMMFIQDDHDKYTNFTDFSADMLATNNITSSVTMATTLLTKIRDDYDNLIPTFITNKELMDSDKIITWIGTAIK